MHKKSYRLLAVGIGIAGAALIAVGLYFLLTDPALGNEVAGVFTQLTEVQI